MHALSNSQGLAVGAETRGIRLSGNLHSGGYNHGPVLCDVGGSR